MDDLETLAFEACLTIAHVLDRIKHGEDIDVARTVNDMSTFQCRLALGAMLGMMGAAYRDGVITINDMQSLQPRPPSGE